MLSFVPSSSRLATVLFAFVHFHVVPSLCCTSVVVVVIFELLRTATDTLHGLSVRGLWSMASLGQHSFRQLDFSMQDSIDEVSHLRVFENNGINEDLEPIDSRLNTLAFAT